MSSRLGIAGIVLLAAFGLAACGGGGGGTATAPPTDPPAPAANPEEERSAIQTAINAAGQALAVVTAAGDNATEAQIMAAEAAVARARAAIAAADDLPATEIAQHNTALGLIDMPLMAARSALDERQRVADVGAARSAASQSSMDADSYATKAEAAADDAETTAPDSVGATAAREAATAARMAANAAKAAHDAITDDMTKAEADEQKDKAAAEVVKAMSQYMTAKRENDTIQTAAATGREQQRMRDVAAASDAAGMAVEAAFDAKNDADTAANAAEEARDAAREAYLHAIRARTDSETAKAELDKAEAAAMAARTAADAANAAYLAAKSAADGIENDGTADAAQAAQMTAEDEQGNAVTAQETAEGHRMTAETAQSAAETARDTHVIALLIRANGQNINEPIIDDSSTPADESMTVAQRQEAAAERAVTALNTAAAEDDNGEDGTTATATWPGDVAATDTAEAMPGALSIMVTPEASGNALTFETRASRDAMDLNNDGDTDDPGEAAIANTAGNIAELGGFSGYDISEGNRHVIVFTDKQQGAPAVAEVTAVTARTIDDQNVSGNTVTDLGTRSGNMFTGVTYFEGTDTSDPGTAYTGTLTCPVAASVCTATTAADGTITVVGYEFSGSRPARAAVAAVAAMENNNYLAFGVWMDEDGDSDGTADDPQIGAFAAGGSAVTTLAQEITGTARYEGSATGVYTAGSSVDYFQGDAELTADFGANDAQGAITGMIDNIVAGGVEMSDVIHLNDNAGPTDNIAADGTFSGDARMGTATTVDAVTTYTHNGSWSGQFFNGTADDTDTADVNESHVAPGSVAGTFGVTGTTGEGDDAVTRSYVGSFGAHKQ